MLTVARVTVGLRRVVDTWVVIDVYETPIVAGDDQLPVWTLHHLINVGAIFSRWVSALDVPAQFDRSRCPDSVLSVGETSRIVSLIRNVEVQLLVGTADCSDVGGVSRPIEARDEGVVLGEGLIE